MMGRRLGSAALVLVALAGAPTLAFEVQPYSKEAAQGAIASGKPVIIEVYASWCPICQAQATAVDAMKNEAAYKDIAFFRVDYDKQKDAVNALHSSRATLIVYRGGKEIARQSWGATDEDVATMLMKATK
jgi:thiol-disulfide isomerase/thioredoxin